MEYFLLIISLLLIVVGLFGSFLPVLPGPPISWLGILLLYFVPGIEMDYWFLGISLFVTLTLVILDYVIPAQGTKKFGGTKYGVWGTNIGLVVGIFAPIPLGFIIGPFVGAFVGELIYNSKDVNRAAKAATGSFVGFLLSSFLKFVLCAAFLGYFIHMVIKYWTIWF
nr:DUF456 domain-containing protein [uncultured Flavobacterium sp.]